MGKYSDHQSHLRTNGGLGGRPARLHAGPAADAGEPSPEDELPNGHADNEPLLSSEPAPESAPAPASESAPAISQISELESAVSAAADLVAQLRSALARLEVQLNYNRIAAESSSLVPQGIENVGNTCFANSLLQSLSSLGVGNLPLLARICPEGSACWQCDLAVLVSRTLRALHVGCTPSPETLIRLRDCIPGFGHGRQEDASDFLRRIRLSFEHVRSDFLGGKLGIAYETKVVCSVCPYVSTTRVASTELMMDRVTIPSKGASLDDLLRGEFSQEFVEDWRCESRCGATCGCTRRRSLSSSSQFVALCVRRFNGTHKLNGPLSAPLALDVSACSASASRLLVSAVLHLGSTLHSGHYVSIRRDAATGEYLLFNDTSVKVLSAGEVTAHLRDASLPRAARGMYAVPGDA